MSSENVIEDLKESTLEMEENDDVMRNSGHKFNKNDNA